MFESRVKMFQPEFLLLITSNIFLQVLIIISVRESYRDRDSGQKETEREIARQKERQKKIEKGETEIGKGEGEIEKGEREV